MRNEVPDYLGIMYIEVFGDLYWDTLQMPWEGGLDCHDGYPSWMIRL